MKQTKLRIGLAAVLGLLSVANADAACLTIYTDNSVADMWINHCSGVVGVRWNDNGVCRGWSCMLYVGPGGEQSFNKTYGRINWRECHGSGCTP